MPAEGGQAVQMTKQGGHMALESPDGKTLYYAKSCDVPGLWKVPVQGGEETRVLEQLAPDECTSWGVTAEVKPRPARLRPLTLQAAGVEARTQDARWGRPTP